MGWRQLLRLLTHATLVQAGCYEFRTDPRSSLTDYGWLDLGICNLHLSQSLRWIRRNACSDFVTNFESV